MTAADQFDTLVARPKVDTLSKMTPPSKSTSLHRRSSIQKIIYMCNQGYSAFPHVLIRLQDFQTTVSIDFAGLIAFLRSTYLTIAVGLSVVALFAQLVFLVAMTCSSGYGPMFFTVCATLLGYLAFRCFNVTVAKRVHRSLSCRKKID